MPWQDIAVNRQADTLSSLQSAVVGGQEKETVDVNVMLQLAFIQALGYRFQGQTFQHLSRSKFRKVHIRLRQAWQEDNPAPF